MQRGRVKDHAAPIHWGTSVHGALKTGAGQNVHHPPGNLGIGASLLRRVNVDAAEQSCFRLDAALLLGPQRGPAAVGSQPILWLQYRYVAIRTVDGDL
jgi:hypothetical protein